MQQLLCAVQPWNPWRIVSPNPLAINAGLWRERALMNTDKPLAGNTADQGLSAGSL